MQFLSTDCSAALILCPSTAKLRSLYLPRLEEKERKPFSMLHKFNSHLFYSRAVAQAVSHQPLVTEACVWSQASPLGIYGGQSGMGQAFLWVFLFSAVSTSPPLLHAHSFIYPRCNIIWAADSVVKWHTYSSVKWLSRSHSRPLKIKPKTGWIAKPNAHVIADKAPNESVQNQICLVESIT